MRIERIEPSRRKGQLLLTLAGGDQLKITEQELLDFGLCAGDELDEETLARLKKAAGVSGVKVTAADLVGRRTMSRRDLEKKLMVKGASEQEARYAAEWLEAIGAIDDADYAARLVRHYGELGYGPAYVRQKLFEKGVPRELWDEAMDALPDPAELIGRYLESKLHGTLPDEKEKKRLTDALLRRGFSWGEVRTAWNALGADTWED